MAYNDAGFHHAHNRLYGQPLVSVPLWDIIFATSYELVVWPCYHIVTGYVLIIIIYTTYIAPYIWPVWPFIAHWTVSYGQPLVSVPLSGLSSSQRVMSLEVLGSRLQRLVYKHLVLYPGRDRKPVELTKDWGDMVVLASTSQETTAFWIWLDMYCTDYAPMMKAFHSAALSRAGLCWL